MSTSVGIVDLDGRRSSARPSIRFAVHRRRWPRLRRERLFGAWITQRRKHAHRAHDDRLATAWLTKRPETKPRVLFFQYFERCLPFECQRRRLALYLIQTTPERPAVARGALTTCAGSSAHMRGGDVVARSSARGSVCGLHSSGLPLPQPPPRMRPPAPSNSAPNPFAPCRPPFVAFTVHTASTRMVIRSFTNSFFRLYELKKPEKALKSAKSGYAES